MFLVCRNMADIGQGVSLTSAEGGVDCKFKLGKVGSDWLITVSGNYQCALFFGEGAGVESTSILVFRGVFLCAC